MNPENRVEWQLENWLGVSPGFCWLFLALISLGGTMLAVYFYRHTLRTLTGRQRLIFVVLRSGFFLFLIFCLAGPARVERIYASNRDTRALAVLVDRSASMSAPDSRGATRLSSALRVWKRAEADARAFRELRYFRFSRALTAASDLDSAVTSPDAGSETHLYGSLNQLIKEGSGGGYQGIVCLTDGLDTTQETTDECVEHALQNHCPLYFAVGQSQPYSHESLLVHELSLPGQVLRKSQFSARVVVEAYSSHERDTSLSFWMDNQPLAQTRLHLRAGLNLVPWSAPVTSGEPGLLHLECRLGEGEEQETVGAATRVVAQEPTRILFYQGSLDWNFRFINTAVQADPGFSLTGLFSPTLSLSREVAPADSETALTEMPGTTAGLESFQIVVLSNVFANQMSEAQQTALTEYVRGGGGLLFLVSDATMAATFSGTILEKLLPVIFEAASKQPGSESVDELENKMRAVSGSDSTDVSPSPVALKAFAFPPRVDHSALADLFGAASGGLMQSLPEFSTYARVKGTKPGADVLAVHPDDKTEAGVPRALLVTQRFGRGYVTALLTDGLWRWKLSLPTTSQDPQIFWQQLFHTLAREGSAHDDLHFSLQPFFASVGQISKFRLEGIQKPVAPVITAISPDGKTQSLAAQFEPSSNSWSFQLNPDQGGKWRIHAEDVNGGQMETWLRVSNTAHTQELSGVPPDVEGLQRLAQATGGCLLNNGLPPGWSASAAPGQVLVSKRSEPLWDHWIFLVISLGFYITELIWRRRVHLL